MKPCLEQGCPGLAPKGESHCPEHRRGPWPDRPSFKSRYGIRSGQWKRIRSRAIRRDGGRCVQCGSSDHLEVDHIVPVTDGGSSDLDNLQTLCSLCHGRKSARERSRR